MTYLVAAVILVALLGLLNFLLAIAIIARLREHTEKLANLADAPQLTILGQGQPVPQFTAMTVGGNMLSHTDLTDGSIVAFLSPGCSSCVEQLPDFVARTISRPDGAGRVVSVVVADANQSTDSMASELGRCGEVIVESHGGAMTTAFHVKGLPAMCLIGPNGLIRASGSTLDELWGDGKAAPTTLVRMSA